MSLNSRIFGIILFALVVVPFAITQSNQGSVLGVTEDLTNENQSETGSIAGGVIDNRMSADFEDTTPQVYEGLIRLDLESEISVATSLYALAAEVKITHDGNTVDKVVGNSDIELEAGYIAVVNTETFIELGGDPELQVEIPGTLTR
jgi:hypothetical protein